MEYNYQLIFIGNNNNLKDIIIKTFNNRVRDLGLQDDATIIIDKDNFSTNYKTNSPSATLYFGDSRGDFPNLDILDTLIANSVYILPITNDLLNYKKNVPKQLYSINGFELKSELEVESLISNVLECLGLLRLSRRLFISYKRSESRSVASQLFEKLEQSGFDVFLDTHSVRKGDVFQDELWHRLVDTDVVILLNTPKFLESDWTQEEVAKASAMSIGILQIVWPGHEPEPMSKISYLLYLKKEDFEDDNYDNDRSHLLNSVFNSIINQVESFRARSLASRQTNLVSEFMKAAIKVGIDASLQREKFIIAKKNDGGEIALIPTIGVPHAFTYNQSEELINRYREHKLEKIYLLCDHRNIREKWIGHLKWLDDYLPVGSVRIIGIEDWLTKI